MLRVGRVALLLVVFVLMAASTGAFLTPSTPRRTRQHHHRMLAGRDGKQTSRQGAILEGFAALAGITFIATAPAVATVPIFNAGGQSATKKTILITGANSGIGLDASKKLAAAGHEVFVACRTLAKAQEAASAAGAAGAFECDLTSLASVQNFCDKWGTRPIDVLCLNAGVAMNTADTAPKFTLEGFEETIGVNHFGHFLIAQKLLPNLEKSALAHPRLVVTASSVHDPSTPGGNVGPGATLGDLQGLTDFLEHGKRFEMVDGSPFSADKAYKDSKLCNVLFTEEISRRLMERKSKVRCNCFSPGLIPSTGLFRSQNPLFVGLFNFFALRVLGVATTIAEGGNCLVYMVEAPELEDKSAAFLATPPGKPKDLFSIQNISKEAADADKARRFWDLTEKLLAKVTKA